MDFRFKCLLQQIFSTAPGGASLNHFFQRYVTGSLPLRPVEFARTIDQAAEIIETYVGLARCSVEEQSYLEFGAGAALINPLAISLLGFKELTCVDIRKLVSPRLLYDAVQKISNLGDRGRFVHQVPINTPRITKKNLENILRDNFRIKYLAPLDMRDSHLPSHSIDFVVAIKTLEHIRREDLLKILFETQRLLRKGGIAYFDIDYQDHWSYFDKSLSVYSFLRYEEDHWKKYSPSLTYQNRMRHKDYLESFQYAGFEVLWTKEREPTLDQLSELKNMAVNEYFLEKYTYQELSILGSEVFLRT